MTQSIEQKIHEIQAKLARLKEQQKAKETRKKIIVGAVTISNALKDPEAARALATLLRQTVTRETDIKEIISLLEELDNVSIKGSQDDD